MKKFTTLFKTYDELYSEGSPVVISARALIKDNATETVYVQLKFRNISDRRIRAVKVSIKTFDSFGKELKGVPEYQYLDFGASRNEEFGSKNLIELPEKESRSFEVRCTEVLFCEGGSMIPEGENVWFALPKQKTLEEKFGREIAEQYRRDTFGKAEFVPDSEKDIWRCACGTINKNHEGNCNVCRHEKHLQFLMLDKDILEGNLFIFKKAEEEKAEEIRVEAQRRAEEARIAAEIQKKKNKKTAAIVIPIVILAIAAIIVFTAVILPMMNYNSAVSLMEEGKYESAVAEFKAMDGYKDSEEQAEKAYKRFILSKEPGESIVFGKHHKNGTELEWIVLEKEEDRVLVLSKYAIDTKPFSDTYYEVSWEESTLRTWLNAAFYKGAFSEEEKNYILESEIENKTVKTHETNGSNNTKDKVFLLSTDEVVRFMEIESVINCKPDSWAKSNGCTMKNGCCAYWLRTSGIEPWIVSVVLINGVDFDMRQGVTTSGGIKGYFDVTVNMDNATIFPGAYSKNLPVGITSNNTTIAVRPAIWIDVSETE